MQKFLGKRSSFAIFVLLIAICATDEIDAESSKKDRASSAVPAFKSSLRARLQLSVVSPGITISPSQIDNIRLPNAFSRYLRSTINQPFRLYGKKVNIARLSVVAGAMMWTNYLLYKNFKNIWWNEPKTKFHFYRGWHRSSGYYDFGPHDSLWFHMDKLGHYYNCRLLSMGLSDLAQWVGYSATEAKWIGALLSSAFYLQIEFFDAHYADWGFSLGDLTANELGAFMPMLGDKMGLSNLATLKFSYHRSDELEKEKYFIEDYGGMTFWWSLKTRRILPSSLKDYWPKFLNIAVGYGITQKAHGEIELYLALDYNLLAIPLKNRMLRKVMYYFNYIHFPAPTLKLTPSFAFHFLYL